MKRLWISLILLSVVTAASIGNICYLKSTVRTITNELDTALEAAHGGDWARSYQSLSKARRNYDRAEAIFSATINEKQLDEVCSNFARAEEGSRTDDHAGYLIELSGLSESVADLLRSETVTLGNLF